MIRTIEIPEDLDVRIQAVARAQNTDAGVWLLEAARQALESSVPSERVLSPMERAVAHIKANPIKSLGPINAADDIEEMRSARMEELAD